MSERARERFECRASREGLACARPPLVFGSCPVREFRNVDTVHMGERASEENDGDA